MDEADKQFAVEYEHGGARWALNIYAADAQDAAAKLRAIQATAVLLGEVFFTSAADFRPEQLH